MISLGDIIMCHYSTLPVMLCYLGEHNTNTNLMLLFLHKQIQSQPHGNITIQYPMTLHKHKKKVFYFGAQHTNNKVIVLVNIYLFVNTHPAISVPLHLRHPSPVLLLTPCSSLDSNMVSNSVSLCHCPCLPCLPSHTTLSLLSIHMMAG